MSLASDVRYGLRMMIRNPGFTLIAVLALALGIGANTAMFTVVNALLVRTLPFDQPDRLMLVLESNRLRNYHFNVISPANFLEWRSRSKSFESLAGYLGSTSTLTGIGVPEQIPTQVVSREFFDVLRVQPILGRTFTAQEDAPATIGNTTQPAPDTTPGTVIISHRFWHSRLGGRNDAIGQTLTLSGNPSTIIGIMPADFRFTDPAVDLWLPMHLNPAIDYRERAGRYMMSIGRLHPGVTPEAAQTEMAGIAAQLEKEFPAFNTNWGIDVQPLRNHMVGDTRQSVLILMGAVACVLLIACANVANLLLSKATGRHREIAVRASLGSGRWRIVRQLLTESLLLSLAGGAVGIAVSLWSVDGLLALAPRNLPMKDEIRPDWIVFAFSAAISVVTGILFGLIPALHASKLDLASTLKQASRSTTNRGHRTRSILVVAEVALSLILLAGAGLLVRSLIGLQNTNPGFDARNTISMRIVAGSRKYATPESRIQLFERAIERVRNIPGVAGVATSTFLPGSPVISGTRLSVEGRPPARPGESPTTQATAVDPDFFKTMHVRLISGRLFDARDNVAGKPLTFVVNEAFAKKTFPNESPLGKRIRVRMDNTNPGEIVGVVADIRHTGLAAPPKPTTYYTFAQLPIPMAYLMVRSAGPDPGSLVPAITRAVQSVDPEMPLSDIRTIDSALDESIARIRFTTILLGIFSGLALLLAVLGLYGVLSYTVTQRTQEIGVRMALGAQPAEVHRLMLMNGLRLVLIGLVIGVAGSALLVRSLQTMLYGVEAWDPGTWVVVPAVLVAAAAAAAWIPAWRAARLQPSIALRYE